MIVLKGSESRLIEWAKAKIKTDFDVPSTNGTIQPPHTEQ